MKYTSYCNIVVTKQWTAKWPIILRMLSSELYKTIVSKVTFVGFRGVDRPSRPSCTRERTVQWSWATIHICGNQSTFFFSTKSVLWHFIKMSKSVKSFSADKRLWLLRTSPALSRLLQKRGRAGAQATFGSYTKRLFKRGNHPNAEYVHGANVLVSQRTSVLANFNDMFQTQQRLFACLLFKTKLRAPPFRLTYNDLRTTTATAKLLKARRDRSGEQLVNPSTSSTVSEWSRVWNLRLSQVSHLYRRLALFFVKVVLILCDDTHVYARHGPCPPNVKSHRAATPLPLLSFRVVSISKPRRAPHLDHLKRLACALKH